MTVAPNSRAFKGRKEMQLRWGAVAKAGLLTTHTNAGPVFLELWIFKEKQKVWVFYVKSSDFQILATK